MKYLLMAVLCLPIFTKAQTISTIASTGVWTCAGEGIPAISAGIGQLQSIAVDTNGNVYIGSITCRQVKKNSTSGIITTVVGTGTTGSSGDGGPAILATLGTPSALALDLPGNLYIADGEYNVIRKVTPSGIISTIAGDATIVGGGYGGDGGPATLALLHSPEGLAIDTSGNIFISDRGNSMIRKISTSGIITRYAGTGTSSYTGDGGPALSAGIQAPTGIAIDRTGNIYVSDIENNRVRKISTAGIITCYAGTTSPGYSGDSGPATLAELKRPNGLATDKYGNLYIADVNNSTIRKVNTNGIITTYAGIGTSGHSGDGGPSFSAQLKYPQGIAVDKNGFKYIAEIVGAYVRKVDSCLPPDISPILGDSSMCTGMSVALSDSAVGGVWSVNDTSVATISSDGVLTGISKGAVVVTYTKTNTCATIHTIRRIVVGPYAGKIEGWNSFGNSGIDTFCYGASFTTSGAPGGTWGLTDTTVATISSTGHVMPIGFEAIDTVFYITTDTCGSDTAYLPFIIVWCPDNVKHISDEPMIKIYPNPACMEINISTPFTITDLVIESISGKEIYHIVPRRRELPIDVSLLPSGMYLIRINHVYCHRFMKQ